MADPQNNFLTETEKAIVTVNEIIRVLQNEVINDNSATISEVSNLLRIITRAEKEAPPEGEQETSCPVKLAAPTEFTLTIFENGAFVYPTFPKGCTMLTLLDRAAALSATPGESNEEILKKAFEGYINSATLVKIFINKENTNRKLKIAIDIDKEGENAATQVASMPSTDTAAVLKLLTLTAEGSINPSFIVDYITHRHKESHTTVSHTTTPASTTGSTTWQRPARECAVPNIEPTAALTQYIEWQSTATTATADESMLCVPCDHTNGRLSMGRINALLIAHPTSSNESGVHAYTPGAAQQLRNIQGDGAYRDNQLLEGRATHLCFLCNYGPATWPDIKNHLQEHGISFDNNKNSDLRDRTRMRENVNLLGQRRNAGDPYIHAYIDLRELRPEHWRDNPVSSSSNRKRRRSSHERNYRRDDRERRQPHRNRDRERQRRAPTQLPPLPALEDAAQPNAANAAQRNAAQPDAANAAQRNAAQPNTANAAQPNTTPDITTPQYDDSDVEDITPATAPKK